MTNLIVVAHPDDEVIGLGGQLTELEDVGVIYVTDGAPRDMQDATEYGFATEQAYSAARRLEAEKALALAGLNPGQLCYFGIPDKDASLNMTALSRQLAQAIRTAAPLVVWTHPYEGGHPDHDATALAVQSACTLLGDGAPERREFTSYHAGGESIVIYDFLPHANAPVTVVRLSPEAVERKQRMIDCFATQGRTLEVFRGSAIEKWRPAPLYDFTSPPHPGTVYYDHFPWGMRSTEWLRRAGKTLSELGLA